VGIDVIDEGECKDFTIDNCECVEDNAECTNKVLGCDFEGVGNNTCQYESYAKGWSKIVAGSDEYPSPRVDATFGQSVDGSYLLLTSLENDFIPAPSTGPPVSPLYKSKSCSIKFKYNVKGNGTLFLGFTTTLLPPNLNIFSADSTTNGRDGDYWYQFATKIPLVTSAGGDPLDQIPVFSATLGKKLSDGTYGQSWVAIDDIEIDCGSQNNTVGTCQCNIGYVNIATDGTLDCQVEDGTVDRSVVVGSCPDIAPCRLKQACLFGAEDIQCSTGTAYRNRDCAVCNYETTNNIFPGYCPSSYSSDNIVDTCADGLGST